jgi:hypothetical protein
MRSEDIKSILSESILKKIEQRMEEEYGKRTPATPATPEQLTEMAAEYFKSYEFRPGDLVMWKPGMKIANLPEYNQPAVVLDVRPGQVDPTNDAATSSFRDPCDVRFGTIVQDGHFVGYWLDSKRFMPYRRDGDERPVQTGELQ